jgi:prepilin-type N-terminal cleavage/methylation domain-containing protein
MIKKLVNNRRQPAFTLVELVVAVAISGIMIAGITTAIVQSITVSAANKTRMEAIKQVENAIHWIERDVQMASSKSISPNNSTVTSFPLSLRWPDFSDDSTHAVSYTIVNGILQRNEVITDMDGHVISNSSTRIASNVITGNCNYIFDGSILELNIKVDVNGYKPATELRTLYVIPRVAK